MIAFHQVSCEGGVEIFHWGVDGKNPQTWSFHWILQTATKNIRQRTPHRKPSKTYSCLVSFQQEPKEATKPTPSPPEGWLIEVDLKVVIDEQWGRCRSKIIESCIFSSATWKPVGILIWSKCRMDGHIQLWWCNSWVDMITHPAEWRSFSIFKWFFIEISNPLFNHALGLPISSTTFAGFRRMQIVEASDSEAEWVFDGMITWLRV